MLLGRMLLSPLPERVYEQLTAYIRLLYRWNDRMNLTDIGAAMMRGFDIPGFKKEILREIRQTKEVPSIEQFWANWLHQMSNGVRMIEASFREILDLDANQEAGILPMQVAPMEAAQEAVSA